MCQIAPQKLMRQNVDWLTEFFSRVSNAEDGKEISPQVMKGAFRAHRKVSVLAPVASFCSK
jgi:hypothetical protein